MQYWDFTPEQELLLEASLRTDETAVDLWSEWLNNYTIEDLNFRRGAMGMLPMLYKNLKLYDFDHPSMEKVKGIYRLAWSDNQLTLKTIKAMIQALESVRIYYPIFTHTVASLASLYNDWGLRRIMHIDMFISDDQLKLATNVLAKIGWIHSSRYQRLFRKYHPTAYLNNNERLHLRINTRPLQKAGPSLYHQSLERKVTYTVTSKPNFELLFASAEIQRLMTIVEPFESKLPLFLTQIADIVWIFRTMTDSEWDDLWHLASSLSYKNELRYMVNLVAEKNLISVPSSVAMDR